MVCQLAGTKLKKLDTVKITVGGANTTKLLSLEAGSEYFLSMTAKDTKKGSVYYNVSANVKSVSDASADVLALPETDRLANSESDALSFGAFDADMLADVSAVFNSQKMFEESGFLACL